MAYPRLLASSPPALSGIAFLGLFASLTVGAGCGSSPPAGGNPGDDDAGSGSNDSSVPTKDGGGQGGDSGVVPDSGDASTGDGAGPDSGTDAAVDAGPPIDPTWSGRPPAAPLFVRNPYLSIWSPADSIRGTWPTLWNGNVKGMAGIARIDGTPFLLLGAPSAPSLSTPLTATSRTLTPTKTEYVLTGGGVAVTLDFLSPVEPGDLRRQSAPIGYLSMSAKATDGASHTVTLYVDISAEWANGDTNQLVNWSRESLSHTGGTLTVQSFTSATPQPLSQVNDYVQWGTAFVAADAPNMTTAIGEDIVVRTSAANTGALDNSIDANMPRAINNQWPVLGFNFDLGSVTATATAPVTLEIGLARDPAVSYQGAAVAPLWKAYWSTYEAMAADAYDDAAGAASRASALDQRIVGDARAAQGDNYAALCTLALRQAFGGTELVGTQSNPWLFLKEISSDGNVSTVDVIYPASPVFLYTNPYLLRLLLQPLLEYAESGLWKQPFCEHDIGANYPVADGHNDGGGENMPVEETANMLLMMAAYTQRAKPADAAAYATAHYKVAKQWADFLVTNGLDPVGANHFSTDDFSPAVDHNANLGLKGVLGVGAFGILAQMSGNSADAASYAGQAKTLMSSWVTKATSTTGQTLFAYDQAGTWGLKYNAFFDKLLGLNLLPSTLLATDAAYYKTQAQPFGLPLDSRFTNGAAGVAPWASKSDWQLWAAAAVADTGLITTLINGVYDFATTSNARVPFSDYYDTKAGQQVGFQARPVQGGMFSFLAMSGTSIVAP